MNDAFVTVFLFMNDAEYLFYRGAPGTRFGEAVFKHRGHSILDSELAELGARGLAHDGLAYGRIGDEHFADAQAAGVARAPARATPGTAVENVAFFDRVLE